MWLLLENLGKMFHEIFIKPKVGSQCELNGVQAILIQKNDHHNKKWCFSPPINYFMLALLLLLFFQWPKAKIWFLAHQINLEITHSVWCHSHVYLDSASKLSLSCFFLPPIFCLCYQRRSCVAHSEPFLLQLKLWKQQSVRHHVGSLHFTVVPPLPPPPPPNSNPKVPNVWWKVVK